MLQIFNHVLFSVFLFLLNPLYLSCKTRHNQQSPATDSGTSSTNTNFKEVPEGSLTLAPSSVGLAFSLADADDRFYVQYDLGFTKQSNHTGNREGSDFKFMMGFITQCGGKYKSQKLRRDCGAHKYSHNFGPKGVVA